MNADEQVRRYRDLMGDEALARAFREDGRTEDGNCAACGARVATPHRRTCPHLARVVVERVSAPPPAA